MYFHTDSTRTVEWLARVLDQAAVNQRSVRLAVGGDGSLKVKVGEGVWTAPIPSTPDADRDMADRYGTCQSHPTVGTHRLRPDCEGGEPHRHVDE